MRRKLILITGSPWVGKTAVAERLFLSLENSALFDGDRAWTVHPFSVSDPRLRCGDRILSFALSVYLEAGVDYVICPAVVLLYQEIRDAILRDVPAGDFDVLAFRLTCSRETLGRRFALRGGQGEPPLEWLRLPPLPGDIAVNTDGRTPEEIAGEIRERVLRTDEAGGNAGKSVLY